MPDWLLAPCGYFSGLWRLDPKVKVLPIWFLLRTLCRACGRRFPLCPPVVETDRQTEHALPLLRHQP